MYLFVKSQKFLLSLLPTVKIIMTSISWFILILDGFDLETRFGPVASGYGLRPPGRDGEGILWLATWRRPSGLSCKCSHVRCAASLLGLVS